ncbi:MAG: tetratricopeptide repeat protein [Burkholderiaceae bacterium]|nr:tetratricopeptide repeat protein [Burkholderiaceae bacterium]
MRSYGVRDVEKMLHLPRRTIRAMVAAGFVNPARGMRNSLQFSFQDLIVLRAAQALADASVPAHRIMRALRQLRRQLPDTMPLSGLSIGAVGDQVVVRDGSHQRQVESGQYVLDFEGDPDGSLSVIERGRPPGGTASEDWFARAATLERQSLEAAANAYGQAIALDPERIDARVNLGRLLHEAGRHRQAERVYREAIAACGPDPLLLYNLGVLLGDAGRIGEAIETYRHALRRDPTLGDAHYNLALLYERLGRAKDAIRHMSEYRRLTRG